MFAGYPIVAWYSRTHLDGGGFNLGGINVTGQVPDLPNLPSRIDVDTPTDAYTRTGFDGNQYNLGMSSRSTVLKPAVTESGSVFGRIQRRGTVIFPRR